MNELAELRSNEVEPLPMSPSVRNDMLNPKVRSSVLLSSVSRDVVMVSA